MKQTLTGKLVELGDLEQIRRTTKPDIYKRILTISTEDGQVVFAEIRNNLVKVLEREGIYTSDNVEITYKFEGSEKQGKKFNNILITGIKKV